MIYNVTAYKETGFGNGNIPSSPAVLENAQKVTLQANQIWKLQDKYLSRIKLNMAYEDAKLVDYMKVGDSYYTVVGLEMSNNVATFMLAYDPINSVGGITAFNILDGWAVRAHANHDDMFENILDEPFSPMKALRMSVNMLSADFDTGGPQTTLIGATIDVTDAKRVAHIYQAYSAGSSDPTAEMLVPGTPEIVFETRVGIGTSAASPAPSQWGGHIKEQKLPNMTLFGFTTTDNVRDTIIKQGVKAVRDLGLTDIITACYNVPGYYGEFGYDNLGRVIAASGKVHIETADAYKYGSYKPKNNKVYALFNMYNVISMGSGESREYNARDLFNNDTAPRFIVFGDPSPNGKPYCQPMSYEKGATLPFQEAVRGSEWLSTPITFAKPEGVIDMGIDYRRRSEDILRTYEQGTVNQGIGVMGSLASSIQGVASRVEALQPAGAASAGGVVGMMGNAYGAYANYINTGINYARNDFDYMKSIQIVQPEIRFARGTALAGFIGNGFITTHTMLSDDDLERFDNFLTMYGYAQSRRLKQDDLTSRKNFNFVQATNVAVTGPNMMDRNAIADLFAGGIRLWHVLPNRAAMSDNPIKVVS